MKFQLHLLSIVALLNFGTSISYALDDIEGSLIVKSEMTQEAEMALLGEIVHQEVPAPAPRVLTGSWTWPPFTKFPTKHPTTRRPTSPPTYKPSTPKPSTPRESTRRIHGRLWYFLLFAYPHIKAWFSSCDHSPNSIPNSPWTHT